MKKMFAKLFVFALGVTTLSGCDLFELPSTTNKGDEEHEVKGLVLKDYSTEAYKNSSYKFDGKVYLAYVDESIPEYEVTKDCKYSTLNTSTLGPAKFEVSYEGSKYVYSKAIYINIINEQSLDGIELKNFNTSVKKDAEYTIGEEAKVIAVYSNSDVKEKDVTSIANIDISEIDTANPGKYKLYVSFKEGNKTVNASEQITVYASKLKSISAVDYTGEVEKGKSYTFDGKIIATFDDDTTKDVTEDCKIGKISTSSVGEKGLVISYEDKFNEITKNITVKIKVVVRLISISALDLDVAVGRKKMISLTCEPSNATNKKATFNSRNELVATVNDDGLVTGVGLGTTTIDIISLENDKITTSINVSVKDVVPDEWTILVYVCGSDLESQASEATLDLAEMQSVTGQPDDMNVVIQAGGAKTWDSTYCNDVDGVIDKDKQNRFHLVDNNFIIDSQTEITDMGRGSTLENFIEWGINTYPADKIGLILWNHGGALNGCCNDEITGGSLSPKETAEAIATAKTNTGYSEKFEFVGYDCCLMQVQDIAGLNSDYAKYQVASEESEWGYGWSYDEFFDDIYARKSTEDILKECVDGFKRETTTYFGSQYAYMNNQTLSYLDLNMWSDYEDAWEDMALELDNVINSNSDWQVFKSIVFASQKYGEASYYGEVVYPFDVFDAGDFLNRLKTSTSYRDNSTLLTKIENVEYALSDLVCYEWHGQASSGSHGVSFFCPLSGFSGTSLYQGVTTLTNWCSLCLQYWNH